MLYLTAPAVAAFARYYMIDDVAGLNGKTRDDLPSWYDNWSRSGLIAWVDHNQDGIIQFTNHPGADPIRNASGALLMPNEMFKIDTLPPLLRNEIIRDMPAWVASQGSGRQARANLLAAGAAHQPDIDIIVLATPEMAGLADWVVALMAAGGLAAALSTASGLLLVISSSFAHDLYFRLINPAASERQRLRVGRIFIGLAVLVAGYAGIHPPGFVGEVVAFAFGLAAASFFPAIVLGIFSKRVHTVPAVSGMVVGLAFTAFDIATQTADKLFPPEGARLLFGDPGSFLRQPWCLGIHAQGIGAVGMALNFAVTLLLTPFFPAPGPDIQDMIDRVREPEGFGPAVVIESAPMH
jgi:cation/acetate symporter